MANISDKLNTIKNAKENIKSSIEAKGVSVGDVSIEEYSSKIDEIEAAWDTSQIRRCDYIFQYNRDMIIGPCFNTVNAISHRSMYEGCSSIETIQDIDCSSSSNIYNLLTYCPNLKNLGKLINLGKKFTRTSSNYSDYWSQGCGDGG